ncbi:hypothetical protein [Larkinella rosea]|uniref:Uncharacterized protein n=1 Tax=Larkinella rosea TaxID=2025312 RepID=A0A3P1BSE7_9BACT|nr:hypothetical protein [Larkinella rosea]RRB03829.1 hypothetical protein EHT25_09830 [Larkinella rosea]
MIASLTLAAKNSFSGGEYHFLNPPLHVALYNSGTGPDATFERSTRRLYNNEKSGVLFFLTLLSAFVADEPVSKLTGADRQARYKFGHMSA